MIAVSTQDGEIREGVAWRASRQGTQLTYQVRLVAGAGPAVFLTALICCPLGQIGSMAAPDVRELCAAFD
ncbi:hypothetical protein ADK64_28915 [Streptomyces sp. MMG1121]|nr:hypothetical protein ADK64_28915 [Streptomyces sp. MMG1121]